MAKSTQAQQDACKAARAQLLFDAAKAGNKKAQTMVVAKGGKR